VGYKFVIVGNQLCQSLETLAKWGCEAHGQLWGVSHTGSYGRLVGEIFCLLIKFGSFILLLYFWQII